MCRKGNKKKWITTVRSDEIKKKYFFMRLCFLMSAEIRIFVSIKEYLLSIFKNDI
jgi:hypothetical protein